MQKYTVFYTPSFAREAKEALTARDNSIGSSGGTTDVKISVHSRNSLYLLLVGSSQPFIQTYAAAMIANIRRNNINANVSRLFAVTRFTPNRIVLRSFPCDVLNDVLKTYATQPLS